MFKWLFGGKKEDEGAALAGGNAEVVVVTRKVDVPRETAFAAFVDRFDQWWPRERRMAGGAITVEPSYNGKVRESGEVIGTVLSFSRPEHLVIGLQLGPNKKLEPSEATASRVDVRFAALDPNTTEVVVVHRDFPRHGDGWQSYRAEMASKTGWPALIEAYAKTVAG